MILTRWVFFAHLVFCVRFYTFTVITSVAKQSGHLSIYQKIGVILQSRHFQRFFLPNKNHCV